MGLNHAGYKARLKAIFASMWNAADGNPWDEKRYADAIVDATQEYIESGDVLPGIPVQISPIPQTIGVGKMK